MELIQQNWGLALFIYCACSLGIFGLAVQTGYEDVRLALEQGEKWEAPDWRILGAIFITSMMPVVNIVLFVNTLLYRRGVL